MTKVRYVEAKYDSTFIWDIEDVAERNNFKIEDIEKLQVGKWVRLWITLKDGTVICEEGNPNLDATNWKWSTEDSFLDDRFEVIDYE